MWKRSCSIDLERPQVHLRGEIGASVDGPAIGYMRVRDHRRRDSRASCRASSGSTASRARRRTHEGTASSVRAESSSNPGAVIDVTRARRVSTFTVTIRSNGPSAGSTDSAAHVGVAPSVAARSSKTGAGFRGIHRGHGGIAPPAEDVTISRGSRESCSPTTTPIRVSQEPAREAVVGGGGRDGHEALTRARPPARSVDHGRDALRLMAFGAARAAGQSGPATYRSCWSRRARRQSRLEGFRAGADALLIEAVHAAGSSQDRITTAARIRPRGTERAQGRDGLRAAPVPVAPFRGPDMSSGGERGLSGAPQSRDRGRRRPRLPELAGRHR